MLQYHSETGPPPARIKRQEREKKTKNLKQKTPADVDINKTVVV